MSRQRCLWSLAGADWFLQGLIEISKKECKGVTTNLERRVALSSSACSSWVQVKMNDEGELDLAGRLQVGSLSVAC